MKKRLVSLLLVLLLVTGLVPEVFAADSSAMTDISGHWAEDYIRRAMDSGLFNGISDTEFGPNGSMTRGMFVTVLGRLAGVDPTEFKSWYIDNLFSDVSANDWYAPYVNWAARYGITRGVGDGKFLPDEPVNREQIATLVQRFVDVYHYGLVGGSELPPDPFLDAGDISDFAKEAVDRMQQAGLMVGQPADAGLAFAPHSNATRAECATVFLRLSGALEPTGQIPLEPTGISVEPTLSELNVGETATLTAAVLPQDAANRTVTWVSENPEIASVDIDGNVRAVGVGSTWIHAYTFNGVNTSVEVRCTPPEPPEPEPDDSLTSWTESYGDKCNRVFGKYVSRQEYRDYYKNNEEALEHMETIEIRAWDFTDSTYTQKYTRTFYLTVNKAVAPSVKQAFEDIYNGKEQFPIHSIGAYRYDPPSEHCLGVAIDINPVENPYIVNGQTIVGDKYEPGVNPYSIPTNGEVAQILNSYGFTQGIWSNSVDYMHFSYFGW